LLACSDCDRFYIVSIVADSDLLGNAAGVQRRASKIFLLNDKGEKRELVRFSPKTTGSSEALFFFKRYDANGMPLLSPRNTSFSFNFGVEPQDDDPIRIMERIEVKVPLIVRQNQVIF
nr:hypothetical protein [Pyrinomonadaceae bacterium]